MRRTLCDRPFSNQIVPTGAKSDRTVEPILAAKPHPEQGFRACLGILRLVRGYGPERLEAALSRSK